VVCADDLTNVLGVEARRERGRADEVAEHDRELAALGGVKLARRGRCPSRNGDCRCALLNGFEIGNRAQQLAAMAEQDAQLLQILIRQIGEDAEIDPVLAKRLRVLLQTDLAKPTVDVQIQSPSLPDANDDREPSMALAQGQKSNMTICNSGLSLTP